MTLRHRIGRYPALLPGAPGVAPRPGWVLALDDERGHRGLGESAPLPGFEMEAVDAAREALEAAARRVATLRAIPSGPAALADAVDELLGADRSAPGARAAVETALADLAAQRAGLSLAAWLNPHAARQIAVNGLIEDAAYPPPRALASQLRCGIRCLKLKVGRRPWPAEHRGLRALARLPGVRLRLDPGGAWSVDQLRVRREALLRLPLDHVEQPLPGDQGPALVALAGALAPLGLAVDQSLLRPDWRAPLLAGNAPLTWILKPAALGGPLSAWRLPSGGVRVVTHLRDGPVGCRMALQLALAIGGPAAHGLAAAGCVRRGRLRRPAGTGLGLRLRLEQLLEVAR